MKVHQLTVEMARSLNNQFLDHLILQGVTKMSDQQKAITNALTTFEAMHFWASREPERARLYACEFELLKPQLESWLNEHGEV